MGIPRFFYYCYKNFETSIEYIIDVVPSSSSISRSPVDFVHFDLNAIIHPVCQEVFKYGNHAPEQTTLLKPVKNIMVTSARINEVYEKVCQVIEKYVDLIKPSSGVYIAIDGVAGMSKCTQQRQRRFRNSSSDDKKFDPNCISTGTVFMDRLCKHIDSYLKKQVSTKWNNLELIFSNDKVSGEGEHKILKHLQLNPELSSVVVSPDADLFMLLLGCIKFDERKLYIFRENIYNNIDCKYFLVDIQTLANEICKHVDDEKKFEKSSVIKDFIFYCFMLGNDFLPHIPCVDLSYRGLELLFDIYSNTIYSHGLLIDGSSVNKNSFIFFLEQIANNEKKILLERYKNNKVNNDPFLERCLLDQDGEDMCIERYRNLYYKNKLNGEEIKKVCKDYIEGMMFVFQYYTKGIPSWKWFFAHHYAPFSFDIARCIKDDDKILSTRFTKGEKMSPIQQLMCILPPSSKKLLPECLQGYYDSDNQFLGKWMSKEVKIDYDFKQNEWESLVLLPFIDVKDFEKVYLLEREKFSSFDKNRDCHGKIFVYYQEYNENTKQMENVVEMVTATEVIDEKIEEKAESNNRAVQKHGFDWQNNILFNVYKLTNDELNSIKYTSEYDLPSELNKIDGKNLSIKTSCNTNSIYMSDCIRFYNSVKSSKPLECIIVFYKQEDEYKILTDIVVVDLTNSVKLMFGDITSDELKTLNNLVKQIPNKKKPEDEEYKKMYEYRDMLQKKSGYIHLDIKCNSQQSRLQCSITKFSNFLEKHKEKIVERSKSSIKDVSIIQKIKSPKRTFNKN